MKTNRMLGGLLVAQLLLCGFMWSGTGKKGFEERALFDVKLEDVSEFQVRRPEGEAHDENDTITIRKVNGQWILPQYESYPIDMGKVEDILGRLTMAKIRRAVAKKKENHNALSVGEREFTKHITLKTPERSYSLYVGNAKGTSMHARFDGQDEVYLARGVAAWKVSHELRNYIDTNYINIDEVVELNILNQAGQIDARQNEDGTWVIAQLTAKDPLEVGRLRSIVNAAKQIKMAQPAGKVVKPEYGLGKQARATVRIKNRNETVAYEIGAEEGEYAYVKAQGQAYVAKVRKFNVSAVLKLTPDELVDKAQLRKASPPQGIPLDRKDWPKDRPTKTP